MSTTQYRINFNALTGKQERIALSEEEKRALTPPPYNYKQERAEHYPDFREYLDGVVKGDQEQIQAYVAACLAVKAKYPKPD